MLKTPHKAEKRQNQPHACSSCDAPLVHMRRMYLLVSPSSEGALLGAGNRAVSGGEAAELQLRDPGCVSRFGSSALNDIGQAASVQCFLHL